MKKINSQDLRSLAEKYNSDGKQAGESVPRPERHRASAQNQHCKESQCKKRPEKAELLAENCKYHIVCRLRDV